MQLYIKEESREKKILFSFFSSYHFVKNKLDIIHLIKLNDFFLQVFRNSLDEHEFASNKFKKERK
jgi:hypothetical protein